MKRTDATAGMMQKREKLLALCAAQRDDLAVVTQQLEGPLKIADRGLAAARYLRRHPVALGLAVAAVAVIRRRGLLTWAQRGLVAWRAYRAFSRSGLRSVL